MGRSPAARPLIAVVVILLGVGVLYFAFGRGGGNESPATTARADSRATSAPASTVAGAATTPTPTTAATAPASPTSAAGTYTVQAGDTLFDLAARWGTTVEAIVAANALADPDVLAVGQELRIP